MKRSFRDKWSAALRSGDYPQGSGFLCKSGRSCCLGVALFVEGIERQETDAVRQVTKFGMFESVIGYEVRDRIGLSNALMQHLIAMNDRDGKSFSEIADYLDTLPVEEDAAP